MTDSIHTAPSPMSVTDALQVLIDQRRDNEVVITHQGSARLWPKMARHELDFHYNPSTMGGAVPFGLGLALSDPNRDVIAITGDGSLLMSLGSLVSVVDAGVTNLSVIVLDNRRYEVTGGQWRPGASVPLDFAAMARAVGFPVAASFGNARLWRAEASRILSSDGPRLASLFVGTADPDILTARAIPLAQQIAMLQRGLNRPE